MTRAASPASNINTSPPVPAPHMAPTIPPASPRRICQWNTFPYLQSVTAAESSTTNKTAKGRHLPSLFLLFSGILPRSWGFRRNCRSCPGRTPVGNDLEMKKLISECAPIIGQTGKKVNFKTVKSPSIFSAIFYKKISYKIITLLSFIQNIDVPFKKC